MPPTDIQDTDLLLVNRNNQTYKITAEDLSLTGPKPIDPTPDEITLVPPTTGDGSELNPYILTSPPVNYGQSVETDQQITITGQKAGDLVVFTDTRTADNGDRFAQSVDIIPSSGDYTTRLIFVDTPKIESPSTYTGLITLGTTPIYFQWTVTTKSPASPPDITAVSLVDTGTDDTKRFEDGSFATAITLTEGEPVSTKSISYKVEGSLFLQPTTSEIVGEDTSTNDGSIYQGGTTTTTGVTLMGDWDNIFDGKTGMDQSSFVIVDGNNGISEYNLPVPITVKNNVKFLTYGGHSGSTVTVKNGSDTLGEVSCSVNAVDVVELQISGTFDTLVLKAYSTARADIYWMMVDDVPYGTSIITLTLADNKDLDKFEVGDLVQQDSGGTFQDSWTAVEPGVSGSNIWYDITYGKDKYVAVASSSTTPVMYSSDGRNWTGVSIGVDNLGWQNITYGNNTFVATAVTNEVMYSPNGIDWTLTTAGVENSNWTGVTYGGGRFVAVGSGGTKQTMYSDNGSSWTAVATPIQAYWYAITYSGDQFVALALTGEYMYSADGTSWTYGGTLGDNQWYDVAYGNNRYVAVSQVEATNCVAWSEDGINWNLVSTQTNGWRGVSFGNGLFTAVSVYNKTMYSPDGKTWTEVDAAKSYPWNSVVFGGPVGDEKFVAVGQSGPEFVMYAFNKIKPPSGLFESYDDTTDPAAPTMTLTPERDGWSANTGNYAIGEVKVLDSATAYLKTNNLREVTGISNAPVYYDTLETTDAITFNLEPGTGRTWDEEFPDGTTITSCVYADNTTFGGGRSPETGTICSNTLQPEADFDYSKALGGLTTVWTGDGTEKRIVNGIDNTAGSLFWQKDRDAVKDHRLYSEAFAGHVIHSNSTVQQQPSAAVVTSFNADGVTLGSKANDTGVRYVGWNFGVAPGFFDIVSYTGDSVNGRQIPHSLGSAPGMMIVKNTTDTATAWPVYHKELGGTKHLFLDKTSNLQTGNYWNNTAPNAQEFVVSPDSLVNSNGSGYVAYLFADTPGVIKCGSYTGAGEQTVNVGFEPQWLLVKNTTNTGDWVVFDNKRLNNTGIISKQLFPNLAAAEPQQTYLQFNDSGWEYTVGGLPNLNDAGDTYIYVAIAAPVVRSLTQAEVNATKLLFETTDYRRCKHMCDVTARAAAIRAQFEAQGYTTQQINDLLNETVTPAPETPVAISGYYPLYTTESASNAAGDGTSHTHEFDGVTYYMPNGVTFYHGDYGSGY